MLQLLNLVPVTTCHPIKLMLTLLEMAKFRCGSPYRALPIWMDIGALWIEVYASSDNSAWTYKKTYRHTDCPDLLDQDDYHHSGHVTYQVAAGK